MQRQADAAASASVKVPHQRDAAPEPVESTWPFDPIELALDASAEMADSEAPPDALCPEIGRRMLLAQLQYSRWVLRRVEKVEFERERSVSRRLTVEFLVRPDAPVFEARGGTFYLVPLSIMQRRTLVNLDLRDESGASVSMPGLRLAQQLDESALLAAAATTAPQAVLPGTPGRAFVQTVVAGRRLQVEQAFTSFGRPRPDDGLDPLRENALFTETLYRLRRNFTLYLFLPTDRGRHRLLRMSFDEPTSWKYQIASLRPDPHAPRGLRGRATEAEMRADPTTREVYHYEPGYRAGRWPGFCSAIGITPTKIRFQVPSAEHTASYHFEAVAPLGLRIVRAGLVAGRPNNPLRHVSADYQDDHSPTVGLHATQIPYGSLCRAQVDLRLPTRGWLTTLLVSCGLVCAVLATVAQHWYRGLAADWTAEQATNICVLLVSTSAGVAAVLAQREFGGLAARLLVWMRGLGLVAISLPIVMAGFLAYSSGTLTESQALWQERTAYATTGISAVIALFVLVVWWCSKQAERRVDAADRRTLPRDGRRTAVRARARGRRAEKVKSSPWDMTRAGRGADVEHADDDQDFSAAVKEYGFDKASIGIRSAEGWHEWYAATDEGHRACIAALEKGTDGAPSDGPRYRCGDFGTACASGRRCPRRP